MAPAYGLRQNPAQKPFPKSVVWSPKPISSHALLTSRHRRKIVSGTDVTALLDELERFAPTVLIVEDAHWADDATLDVLGYVARRVESRPALLVLTVRDEAVDPHHPLHRLYGMMAPSPVHRLELTRLSREAVRTLPTARGVTPTLCTPSRAATRSSSRKRWPRRRTRCRSSVRTRCWRACGCSPGCRDALDGSRSSRRPSRPSWRRRSAHLDALEEAEIAGLIELRADGLGFRHELARRAIERVADGAAAAAAERRGGRGAAGAGGADRGRLLHHAAEAGDVDDAAGRGAGGGARGGAGGLAPAGARALRGGRAARRPAGAAPSAPSFLNDYAWELYNAHRFRAAVDAAAAAERLYSRARRAGPAGDVPRAAVAAPVHDRRDRRGRGGAQRAVVTLLDAGDEPALAYATLYLGGILAQTRPEFAGERARARRRAGAARAAAGARCAVPELPRRSCASRRVSRTGCRRCATASRWRRRARITRRPRAATATWRSCCCGWGAWTSSSAACARAWTSPASAASGRTPTTSRCTAACCCSGAETGTRAEAGLRKLLRDVSDPGMLFAYSAPWLGRLLARRGDRAAGKLIADAWLHAQSGRLRIGLAYAGIARAEWAWLTGDPDAAREVAAVMLPRMENPGAAPFRGELLRYLKRAGLEAEPFEGCPPGYDAGLRGDWRAAAAVWRRAGDPYETALEQMEGDAEACAAAVVTLNAWARPPPPPSPATACVRSAYRPARPARDHPRQPGGPHGPPGRGARTPPRGPHERRDRRPPGVVGADRRPSRGRDPLQAGRLVAPRGRGARALSRSMPPTRTPGASARATTVTSRSPAGSGAGGRSGRS